MNAIDFMRETAQYMAKDRPDIYTPESALDQLSRTMDEMREIDESTWTSFASFFLVKNMEEGIEEWLFARKVSTLLLDEEEGEAMTYGWTKDSGTLKTGVNLPDILDDLEFE